MQKVPNSSAEVMREAAKVAGWPSGNVVWWVDKLSSRSEDDPIEPTTPLPVNSIESAIWYLRENPYSTNHIRVILSEGVGFDPNALPYKAYDTFRPRVLEEFVRLSTVNWLDARGRGEYDVTERHPNPSSKEVFRLNRPKADLRQVIGIDAYSIRIHTFQHRMWVKGATPEQAVEAFRLLRRYMMFTANYHQSLLDFRERRRD